jgi:predicted neutral ceramidase superfamily lipid hydrolase
MKIAEVTVSDKKRDANKVINTVIGIYDKYFHITPGSVNSGINAARVVIVPEIIGGAYSLIATNIACLGLYHSFTFLFAHSITTIIVSIATHKLNISEKFVKKLREKPQ